MKRSSNVRLCLMGASALTLAACGDPVPVDVFETAEQCMISGKYSESQCRASASEAASLHLQEAPRYASLAACQEDYGAGQCGVAPGDGAPQQATGDAAQPGQQTAAAGQPAQGSGGSFFVPLFAGYMMGQMLNQGRYDARPLYRPSASAAQSAGLKPGLYTGSGRMVSAGVGSATLDRSALTSTAAPKAAATTSMARRGGFGTTARAMNSGSAT